MDIAEEQLAEEIVLLVREHIGPVAAFRKVIVVKQLPKTRSGKIPRATLSSLVNGKPYKVTVGNIVQLNYVSVILMSGQQVNVFACKSC